MTNPSIRRAISNDAAALSTFAGAVFPLGCPQTAPADLIAYINSELTPASFLALLEDPNVIVLVAESSQRILAYLVLVLRSQNCALEALAPAELRKLYIDAAYHGSGLADALMHCGLSILQAEGPRPIWLSVYSGNARAISFYKKWGFQIAGSQEFPVGSDLQKDFLMLRQLAIGAIASN